MLLLSEGLQQIYKVFFGQVKPFVSFSAKWIFGLVALHHTGDLCPMET